MITATRTAPVELAPAGAPRDEWLAARRDGIGASEIAAVLGISPWESPFSLYWRKVNGWAVDINDEMTAGTRAEPVIADWWAETCDPHENLVIRPSGLYANADRPWQIATPDRLVHMACPDCDGGGTYASGRLVFECPDCGGKGGPLVSLLECKYVVHGWDGWGEPGTDEIPVHYRAQGLWQADVMGVDEVYFAAWHGATFREYLVRRDETDLRMMREAGRRFMQRIEDDDPPGVDEHTATLATLKKLHPSVEDRDVELPADVAAGYRRARVFKQRAEAACDRYEALLRASLGSGRRAVVDGRTVATRSVYDRAGYTVGPATIDRLTPARSPKS